LVVFVPTAAFSPRADFTVCAALSRHRRRPGRPGERLLARRSASASGYRNFIRLKFAGHALLERNAGKRNPGKCRHCDFLEPGSGAIQMDRGFVGLSVILSESQFHPGSSPGFFAGSHSQRRARKRLGNQEIGANGL
jgi:hypothetical protein